MLRRLVIGLAALGAGVLAASLLRTERRPPGSESARAAGSRQPQRRCGAPTRSGKPCSRPPAAGHQRCWQHR